MGNAEKSRLIENWNEKNVPRYVHAYPHVYKDT